MSYGILYIALYVVSFVLFSFQAQEAIDEACQSFGAQLSSGAEPQDLLRAAEQLVKQKATLLHKHLSYSRDYTSYFIIIIITNIIVIITIIIIIILLLILLLLFLLLHVYDVRSVGMIPRVT